MKKQTDRNKMTIIGPAGVQCLLLFLGVLFSGTRLQASLYDEQARLSQTIQESFQQELETIFGKNRASVLVRCELELDRNIQQAIRRQIIASMTPSGTEHQGTRQKEFVWKQQKDSDDKFILPGFPVQEVQERQKDKPIATPEAHLVVSAGVEIKKLSIQVVLDQGLNSSAEAVVKNLAKNYFNLNPGRGDTLQIQRAALPSIWSRMLESPESLLHFIQRMSGIGVILLLGCVLFIAIFILIRSIRKSAETICRAVVAGRLERNVNMAIKQAKGEVSFQEDAEEKVEWLGSIPKQLELADKNRPSVPAETALFFEVSPEDVAKLYDYLKNESPQQIALVVTHLRPEVRNQFIRMLPEGLATETLENIASIQFIDEDSVLKLKNDLEQHIRSSVGGLPELVTLLESADQKTKERLLSMLKKRNPDLAETVREKVLFFGDLAGLDDGDFKQLISGISLEELAESVGPSDNQMTEKVQIALPRKLRQALEQVQAYQQSVPEEKRFKAQDKLVRLYHQFVHEGRIKPVTVGDARRALSPLANKEETARRLHVLKIN